METFEARIFKPELVLLNNSKELEKLYGLIEKDENFIIQWIDDKGRKCAEVVVSTHIAGKVKNGEMKLKAEELGGN